MKNQLWKPLHRLLSFVKCPDSDCAYVHALSIPLYPSLREEEIEHVTKTLKIVSKKCYLSMCYLVAKRKPPCLH